jgi:protein-tyrosine phosphatase
VPEAGPGEACAGSTLLVCRANICRSPMAEALWRVAAARLGRTLPVSSAGLDALPGRPADRACVELLAERGIDLAEHRATRFTPADATRHELVLVMEPEHHRRILAEAPMLAGRVHLLGRWDEGPIEDPYGAGRSEYVDCLARLDQSITAWLDRIVIRQDAIRTE